MALTTDLIAEFVKVTNDATEEKNETTVYGTVVERDGSKYVRLDGSDLLTPIAITADAVDGERVTVMIKNHTATVTGNISSPSARTESVDVVGKKIAEVEILVADKVDTKDFTAQTGRIDTLVSENVLIKESLTASEALIDELEASNVTITESLTAANASIKNLETNKLDASVAEITYATIKNLEATNAEFNNLESTYAEFNQTVTDSLEAQDAKIEAIEAGQITVESLEGKFANIDFSNIGTAAIEKFFAVSGMIDDLVVSEGTVTGELVGVTIKGDLIKGNTIVAEKLVLKDENGLFYALNIEGGAVVESDITDEELAKLQNGLSGEIIIANTITADKINVTDLVAFDATIGGFVISNTAIHSFAKDSVDNTTAGIYLDSTGQVAIGDSSNFIKYYQDTDDTYKLEVSADSIKFGTNKKTVEAAIDEVQQGVDELGTSLDATNDAITDATNNAIESSKNNLDEALKDYVQSEVYETFKSDTTSSLDLIDDKLTVGFEATETSIANVNGELQSIQTILGKYFEFTEDGLTIKAGENTMTLTLDNDIIYFKKNGQQFGWWDGVDFHTGNIYVDVEQRAQFGNFAFVPRNNGSLAFMKVGG